jgi:glycosylphosphatidylinositol transamidase
MPRDWLMAKMREMGVESYTQNFTVEHHLMSEKRSGENVYGVIRAPRHGGTESIVFVVPYEHHTVYKSVPLMLALATHFRDQTYWAKDLIFVFADLKLIGLQAWLQAYHGHPNSASIKSANLPTRGGSIQAALSIEVASSSCDGLDILLEGMNGQLPNLDLFNTMDKLTRANDGFIYLHGRKDPPTRDLVENCQRMIGTSLLGMWQQASCRPAGGHALFLPYHIDALTIRSHQGAGKKMRYFNIARAIEGTTRSLNNLLERFHQSFYYYIMPNTYNYISIGLYIPALVICLASTATKALSQWSASFVTFHTPDQMGVPSLMYLPDVTEVFKLIAVSFICPLILLFSLEHLHGPMKAVLPALEPSDSLLLGISLGFLLAASLPVVSGMLPRTLSMQQKCLYKSLLNFITIISLGSISVSNFSLAYFLALVAVPLMNLTFPAERPLLRHTQKVICMIISPITLCTVLPILAFIYSFPAEPLTIEVAYSQIKMMIVKIVSDNYLYGSNLLTYTLSLFVPL